MLGKNARNLSGMRFGRLLALTPNGRDSARNILWLARCDCGSETTARATVLLSGHTRSCGCLQADVTAKRNSDSATHGQAGKTGAWRSWSAMRTRCLNPNSDAFDRYGGAGITICERWHSFANFFADMGARPHGLTLERKDNAKGYDPDNCRWATRAEQNRNKRNPGPRRHHGDHRAREIA